MLLACVRLADALLKRTFLLNRNNSRTMASTGKATFERARFEVSYGGLVSFTISRRTLVFARAEMNQNVACIDEAGNGTTAELVMHGRHVAVWMEGECIHYSLVNSKTQLAIVPDSADKLMLKGGYGTQFTFATVRINRLEVTTSGSHIDSLERPDGGLVREDAILCCDLQGQRVAGI
eukprot:7823616-Pyramimonas_sp.AAC.1